MPTRAAIRTRLMHRYCELSERRIRIKNDSQQRQSDNWSEPPTERERDEVLDPRAEATAAEMAKLLHSVDRLDANLSGICESCGGPIAPDRMRFVPHAARCLSCATDKALA